MSTERLNNVTEELNYKKIPFQDVKRNQKHVLDTLVTTTAKLKNVTNTSIVQQQQTRKKLLN